MWALYTGVTSHLLKIYCSAEIDQLFQLLFIRCVNNKYFLNILLDTCIFRLVSNFNQYNLDNVYGVLKCFVQRTLSYYRPNEILKRFTEHESILIFVY